MSKVVHFEKSMAELEEIVKQLERGELSLEESLKYYEKGIGIARKCQDTLLQAEQKIETLQLLSQESKPLTESDCDNE